MCATSNDVLPLAPLESIDQVRNYTFSAIDFLTSFRISTKCVRRETSSSGEFNQTITPRECMLTEGSRPGCKLDIFELGAQHVYASANSLEVFVADDALEGGAVSECQIFDDFEIIGEGNALEGEALLECQFAESFEVLVEDDAFEGGAFDERHLFDDCEFIGESDKVEGGAAFEYVLADSFEVFVADDACEGSAIDERLLFNDFELIGESDTREGVALIECHPS